MRQQADELKVACQFIAGEFESAKEKTTAIEAKQQQRSNVIDAMQDWILQAQERVRIQKLL